MNIRCRGPTGQFTLAGLSPEANLASLQQKIAESTDIPVTRQELLFGFPPRPVKVLPNSTISGAGLASNDTIVVRERTNDDGNQTEASEPEKAAQPSADQPSVSETPAGEDDVQILEDSDDEQLARALAASLADEGPRSHSASDANPSRQQAAPVQSVAAAHQKPATSSGTHASAILPDGSAVTRRIIDSDNSCLFNAVGYVMERSRSSAQHLRKVIAEAVANDPDTYNEGFLGKGNVEYQRWIRDDQKWGGAIELSILARFYAREIAAYDIQTKRVDVYGQAEGYKERVMVLYDGLHYDALAQAAFQGAPEELDVTIFETEGGALSAIEQAFAQLVAKAHRDRQFTDTANFTLRCGVCRIGVKGEKEAVQHAQQTGHQSFSEYH